MHGSRISCLNSFAEVKSLMTSNQQLCSGRESECDIGQRHHIAESGRPGPVVIDVPKDVQTEVIEVAEWPAPGLQDSPRTPTAAEIEQFLCLLESAERPVLYVGGGIVAAGCSELRRITRFALACLGCTVRGPDPRAALAQALAAPGPALINVPIHPMENVLPTVPPSAANRDMIERAQEVAHA
jgi:thiamine pyrophosphate-dependent acetolactate synthase large subunit-like protein